MSNPEGFIIQHLKIKAKDCAIPSSGKGGRGFMGWDKLSSIKKRVVMLSLSKHGGQASALDPSTVLRATACFFLFYKAFTPTAYL